MFVNLAKISRGIEWIEEYEILTYIILLLSSFPGSIWTETVSFGLIVTPEKVQPRSLPIVRNLHVIVFSAEILIKSKLKIPTNKFIFIFFFRLSSSILRNSSHKLIEICSRLTLQKLEIQIIILITAISRKKIINHFAIKNLVSLLICACDDIDKRLTSIEKNVCIMQVQGRPTCGPNWIHDLKKIRILTIFP
jgi:hypothetical protein